jgi:hypothetical protein
MTPGKYANGLQGVHINDGGFVEYEPYFTADVNSFYDWVYRPPLT